MKNTIRAILLLFTSSLLFIGCRPLHLCKDAGFSIPKIPFTGSQLRTDGFYYSVYKGKLDSTSHSVAILILYRDGIVMLSSSQDSSEMEVSVAQATNGRQQKNDENEWGLFVIAANNLELESPDYVIPLGCKPMQQQFGHIIDDTTFEITKKSRRFKNGDVNSEFFLHEIYHFRRIGLKPDSTNDFVK